MRTRPHPRDSRDASPCHAQWTLETSNTTADLRGIHNVGGGVAWASGTNGTVLRTEDGGYVWQSCTVPPGAEKLDFRGIQAFDANTAIVMSSGTGDLSRLYKTTDGCHSWKLIFTNPDKDGFFDAFTLHLTASCTSSAIRSGTDLHCFSARPWRHVVCRWRQGPRRPSGRRRIRGQQHKFRQLTVRICSSGQAVRSALTCTGQAQSAIRHRATQRSSQPSIVKFCGITAKFPSPVAHLHRASSRLPPKPRPQKVAIPTATVIAVGGDVRPPRPGRTNRRIHHRRRPALDQPPPPRLTATAPL